MHRSETGHPIIGILGGGQLGRMTAIAAAELGYRCHIFAPPGDAPACDIAFASTRKHYDDEVALKEFAHQVDVITSEFENVPVSAMTTLAQFNRFLSPGIKALSTAQHRLKEKQLARQLGIRVPKYTQITQADDMPPAMMEMKNGAILKTCRFGYDGKGQIPIAAGNNGIEAFHCINGTGLDDYILEEKIDFTAEVSFLVARNMEGNVISYPPSLNHHKNGILRTSIAPAPLEILSRKLCDEGKDAATSFAENLELIGLLAMEMFVTEQGLIFNEIAPRPHNSFHWTIEGCETSQFSQLVRILLGLPFGSTEAMGRWQMDNILGQDMPRLNKAFGEQGVFVHQYGKAEAKTNRKMGHLTRKIG